MSADRTMPQSVEEQRRALLKSVRAPGDGPRVPPTQVPGYEVEKFLGEGAYGEVWVAVDGNTGRRVAIKFYNHRGGVDWSLLSREVEKLAFLFADRYVVQLIDVAWDSDPPYYIMEFLDQGSLEERLERGPLPLGEAVKLFREVAVGLVHSHGKGVLHCDLKPANVLLDQDFRPRLADFGQSRLSHEQKPALGTLFYMAPEQADLAAVPDVRWDVYALGALFYCMLTGQPPCRDEAAVSQIDQSDNLEERLARYRRLIETSPRPSGHRRVPGVDRELAEIIDRCLEPQPARRFPNVQTVLNALDVRALRQARRPLLVLGLLGPALLLLVMSIFAWKGYDRAMSTTEQEVRSRAMEGNLFAAQLAAEMAGKEVERYFRAVETVAQDPKFQDLVEKATNDEQLQNLVGQIDEAELGLSNDQLTWVHEDNASKFDRWLADAEADFASQPTDSVAAAQQRKRIDQVLHARQLHEQFKQVPAGANLQAWFDRCLCDVNNCEADPEKWIVASAFLTEVHGTTLARAYSHTVGGNFGFRTYFNGLPADKPLTWRPGPTDHLTEAHLSAVFRSHVTAKWIIAISVPVWKGGPHGQFLGVAVFTVQVKNFVTFQGRPDQFAVLVDGRAGPHQGLILQHPLIEEMKALPDHFENYKVPAEQLCPQGRPADLPADEAPRMYQDPLGADPNGARFNKNWLAAMRPVSIEQTEGGRGAVHAGGAKQVVRTDTGLVVVVQEDYDAVFDPLRNLGRQLVKDGLVALGVVFSVVTLLWGLVIVVFNESSRSRLVASLRRRAGLKTPSYTNNGNSNGTGS